MARIKYCEKFEYMWERRPRRCGSDSKVKAYKQWGLRVKEGHTERELVEGLKGYGKHCAIKGLLGTEKVLMTATFFGPDKHFETDYHDTSQSQELAAIAANSAPQADKSGHQQAIEKIHGTIEQSLTDRSWAIGL